MAFPTTSLIDNFNRASLGANWDTDPWAFGAGVQTIVANQLAPDATADAYCAYDVQTYGPDCENYITIATKGLANEPVEVLARMGTLGASATMDGYGWQHYPNAGTDELALIRWDNGNRTIIGGGTTLQEVDSGQKIGLSCVGSTITGWYYNGSTWIKIKEVTDATYSAAGYLALFQSQSSTSRLDEFSGGTVVTTARITGTLGIRRPLVYT